jgi:hypothetical protein
MRTTAKRAGARTGHVPVHRLSQSPHPHALHTHLRFLQSCKPTQVLDQLIETQVLDLTNKNRNKQAGDGEWVEDSHAQEVIKANSKRLVPICDLSRLFVISFFLSIFF